MTEKIHKTIAFQGTPGAYSDLACHTVFPGLQTLPCQSFEDAFIAVESGEADLAMIPVDNTIAGRVADVHHLMLLRNIYIIGEHFHPIRHNLLSVKGSSSAMIKHIHSHVHALPQCRKLIKRLGLTPHVHPDTASAAEAVARQRDPGHAAIASSLAAEIHGLEILEADIQDEHHNTTRFLILAQDPLIPDVNAQTPCMTSLIFKVRNIPAALYKSLGGFATNGLSLAKLESYVDENFQAARFYCDVEGHPESESFKLALEELAFYARDVCLLGTYPAHEFRRKQK